MCSLLKNAGGSTFLSKLVKLTRMKQKKSGVEWYQDDRKEPTMSSPLLMTDKYEYTMLSALVANGKADDKATFELFARKLPKGRRYGILGGLGRLIESLKEFTLSNEDLQFLKEGFSECSMSALPPSSPLPLYPFSHHFCMSRKMLLEQADC